MSQSIAPKWIFRLFLKSDHRPPVEVNLIENGFLNEFKLAQANLFPNIAAGRGNHFRYAGPNTGTAPLPIMLAFMTGQAASAAGTATNYANTLFANATFVNALAANDVNVVGGFGTQTFGQVTQAYRDLSTTNDPGGRMIQVVARINF